jgi:hypothetical protein
MSETFFRRAVSMDENVDDTLREANATFQKDT